jgi:hypothetical protein
MPAGSQGGNQFRSLRLIVFEKMFFSRILLHSLFAIVTSVPVAVCPIAPLSAQDVGQDSRAQIVLQLGHSGAVTSVTFSPDDAPRCREATRTIQLSSGTSPVDARSGPSQGILGALTRSHFRRTGEPPCQEAGTIRSSSGRRQRARDQDS